MYKRQQFNTEDMKKVEKMAKKYGILYSVLPDCNRKDGLSEVIFHTAVSYTHLDKDAVQSSKITNEFAKRLGMSEEQLFKCAAEKTRRLFPPVVRSMNDIMREDVYKRQI